MADYNTANYEQQGGDVWVVGGTLTVSGAEDITGTLKINGTAVTATAAELNAVHGATATAAEISNLSGTQGKVTSRVYTNTASGTSLTNSNSETVLGSVNIPANVLTAGSVLRVRALISVTADNSTTTLTARLRLGATTLTGTALITTAATNTSANDVVIMDYVFTALAAPGATAQCRGCGFWQEPGAAGGAFKTAVLGTGGAGAAFATNGVLKLEVTGQWSAADANACQLEILAVTLG